MQISRTLAGAALCAAALIVACSPPRTVPSTVSRASPTSVERREGLILQASEVERRVRRPRPGAPAAQTSPFILKVDARNGASPDLVMGYEEVASGEAIQPHRHLVADEIVFVQSRTGVAPLAGREAAVSAGRRSTSRATR